jgi:hypothetical protein
MGESERVEVGRFVYENGEISGPADYMRERFPAMKEKIESGNSVVFNYGAAGASPSAIVAYLVAVQTDYAGYRGQKEMESWLDRDGDAKREDREAAVFCGRETS